MSRETAPSICMEVICNTEFPDRNIYTPTFLLLTSEFAAACKNYPIVFAIADIAQPLVLLGLRNNENLFVDVDVEGQWAANHHVPAYVRRYPFIFLESADKQQFTLCIDEASSLVNDGAAKAIEAADLLIENRADMSLHSGEKLSLAGFRVIDEQCFNKLPDHTFLEWRERGWLHLVYCHLISTSNWGPLIDRGGSRRTQ